MSAGGLIIPRMINMNESGPKTIAQVEEFLSASALIEFNLGVGGPLGLVGVGGRQIGGVDLAIDADEFFGPTGWRKGRARVTVLAWSRQSISRAQPERLAPILRWVAHDRTRADSIRLRTTLATRT